MTLPRPFGGGSASFTLRLRVRVRVPAWMAAWFRVTVNGRAMPGSPKPGELQSGGATLLDEIWSGAPLRDEGALVARVARVRVTVDAWVSAGLLSRADGGKVAATAGAASYLP
ncbi:hypothetical protein ACWGBH_20995 [Streptomyces massasporeus]